MSDPRKKLYMDEDEYEALCKKYGEEPQYEKDTNPDNVGIRWLDCYGEHAKSLRLRRDREKKK